MPPSRQWAQVARRTSSLTNESPVLHANDSTPEQVLADQYKCLQDEEIEALRSIFMDDFEEVGSASAWNRSADHAFKLHLSAPSDREISVTLVVTFTATYPMTAPLLALANANGLQRNYRQRLNAILEDMPKTLLGSAMVFDIATAVQEVLEEILLAQERGKDLPSLEEERAMNAAVALRAEEERRLELERKRLEASHEEERILEKMVLEEVNRQKERIRASRRRSSITSSEVPFEEPSLNSGLERVRFDHRTELKTEEGLIISFRIVCLTARLRQGAVTDVWTVKPLEIGEQGHSVILVLKQVCLITSTTKEDEMKNKVLDLEKELETLRGLRLTPHSGIIQVLDFNVNREVTVEDDSVSWKINILTEHADKGSLEELLDMVGPLDSEKIRAWTIQLLDALEYYHCNGVIHRDIHAGNVLLVRTRSGSIVLKLADGGFQRHLHEMRDMISSSSRISTAKSAYWIAPEIAQEGGATAYNRKTDIWDFGVVFLQMTLGMKLQQQFASPSAVMDAADFSPSTEDFVRKMFRLDPRKRPAAFELLNNNCLRSNDSILPSQNSLSDQLLSSSTLLSPFVTDRARRDSQQLGRGLSRYSSEFHELAKLGKGAFGEVFKARNKLDGQIYAIKRITQRSQESLSKVLSETVLLSRLNHPYVVRYFNTWLEEGFAEPSDTDEEAISFTESSAPGETGRSIEYGLSTAGLDIISSTGGPQVEFGYTSEDEESSPDAEESSAAETDSAGLNMKGIEEDLERKRTSSISRSQRAVKSALYIQMEYCEKHTLWDLLRHGLSASMERCWQLFRQIVEGLNHIHGHGIIHRDLKPANIFVDISGLPKIGDFGLATSGQYYLADQASSSVGYLKSDLTRSIGTALYVAPELRSKSDGHYTEKVDMYSLGIIFFEMCYPLKTGMERDQVLRAIRMKDHTLPAELQKPDRATEAEIIKALISHKPSERPSTTELLQSGKLPVHIEQETIRQTLQSLRDRSSPYHHQIISAMFSQTTDQAKDYAWDMGSANSYDSNDLLLQGIVKSKLESIFRCHGAVEIHRPIIFPKSNFYAAKPVVQLLDSSGALLQLPYDLTLPYARVLAKNAPRAQKTFAFGHVYRDLYTGGQPRAHGEVDFDIISSDLLDLALKEAEVIKVVDEIIDAFPSLGSTQMCFHVNHSGLLDQILGYCRISATQAPIVKEVISKLNFGQWTWQKIRSELSSPSYGVASVSLDDLARFDFRDTPEKVSDRIKAILGNTAYWEKCSPALSHMTSLTGYLRQLNVHRKIYIAPLSSYNEMFYSGGMLFQCLYDGKARDLFAAGGRYDQLIEQHCPKVQGRLGTCHAVGFNLVWDKLWTSMKRFQKVKAKPHVKKSSKGLQGHWATRRCDVLVACFDAKVLRSAGVNLVRQLWASEISAELAVDTHSIDELMTHYKDDKHSWIVILKQDIGVHGERMLKVKSVVRKEEADIRSSELSSWLRSEITKRNQIEGRSDRTSLVRTMSHPEENHASEGEQDVRVLLFHQKGKKSNRKNVEETARARAQELVQGMLNGPIAAIEVKSDLFDAICETSLSDPDSWRKVIHGVPVAERKYLTQVHELMSEIARDMKGTSRNAFIYNCRTGACVYYDLGRSS